MAHKSFDYLKPNLSRVNKNYFFVIFFGINLNEVPINYLTYIFFLLKCFIQCLIIYFNKFNLFTYCIPTYKFEFKDKSNYYILRL